MAIAYEDALETIGQVYKTMFDHRYVERTERVDLTEAVGRVIFNAEISRQDTPAFDTSAMDGYALDSRRTCKASPTSPVKFKLDPGTMAAGDAPFSPEPPSDDPICVEIMTGAQFPSSRGRECIFDACIKIENTSLVQDVDGNLFISVESPVRKFENRRFAGSDLKQGQEIISSLSLIRPSHVMALAAIGKAEVEVLKKIRVAVICTGSELVPYDTKHGEGAIHRSKIRDSNGPYIKVALQEFGVCVDYLGIVADSIDGFVDAMIVIEEMRQYDLIITTGAVSVGKFDFVRPGLEMMQALIHFHTVAIRPGSPVLFASLSRHGAGPLPLFGLPGNPMAAAVCLRLFVMPFLRLLQGQVDEAPEYATAKLNGLKQTIDGSATKAGIVCTSPFHLDVFRHGIMTQVDGHSKVEMIEDQGPSKVGPWLGANCWVHLPREKDQVREGDRLRCIPMLPKK